MRAVKEITRLYRSIGPDIVHHVAFKPIVLGSVAAIIARVPRVVNAVAGLGYAFTEQSVYSRAILAGLKILLRPLLSNANTRVILQNADDVRLLSDAKLIDPKTTVLIRGSGVDLNQFTPTEPPRGPPVLMLASRMLRHKGVREFVAAARLLRQKGSDAKCVLVGDSDPSNPSSISRAQLEEWARAGDIEWWGRSDDMAGTLAQSHVVCLPSYREGLPKILLEAAAMGRPLIATDVPGCRDVVVDGFNGFLVPPRNSIALLAAMETLAKDSSLRTEMGARSRTRVVEEFGVQGVVMATCNLYREMLADKG
jgi:glycosyltransferase involved in cell wall biosynthesis